MSGVYHNTRSKTLSGPGSLPSGHVPFESQSERLAAKIEAQTATFDSLKNMLNNLKPTSEFEKGLVTYLDFLTNQLKEQKSELVSIRDEMLIRNRNVRETVDGLAESVIKTEQYSRRDTVTVVGLPMHESESQDDLCKKVAETLSLSGSAVKPADLSAVHRNSKGNKLIKGKTFPPSITVRFCRINQKDNVLRGYRNYDVSKDKRRDTRVYQSLTPHYSTLRTSMYDFFNDKDKNFGSIKNVNLNVKWITYQSPTSGFAFKLDSGKFFNGIHMWLDFVKLIHDEFPNCRVS